MSELFLLLTKSFIQGFECDYRIFFLKLLKYQLNTVYFLPHGLNGLFKLITEEIKTLNLSYDLLWLSESLENY